LDIERKLDIKASGQGFSGRFQAMGSPCELLSEAGTPQEAERLVGIAASEAWRIEDKFSRYHDGNIVDRINKGPVSRSQSMQRRRNSWILQTPSTSSRNTLWTGSFLSCANRATRHAWSILAAIWR
jgi:hypothetical protein